VTSTVSIGVLQNNQIKFNPPLPKWKTDALNQVKMNTYMNLFVAFKKSFWTNYDYIYIMSDKKGKYAMWKPLTDTVIICMIIDDEARRVEALDEETIKDEIEDHMKRAFKEFD